MNKRYSWIAVLFAISIIAGLTGCATIPKPSDKFDGILTINMETTGNFHYTGQGRWIEIKNIGTGSTILKKSVNTDGVKYFKLKEGSYTITGFLKAANGDFALATSKTIEIHHGEFLVFDSQLNREFKTLRGGLFSPSNFWVPLDKAIHDKIVADFQKSENSVYWKLVD